MEDRWSGLLADGEPTEKKVVGASEKQTEQLPPTFTASLGAGPSASSALCSFFLSGNASILCSPAPLLTSPPNPLPSSSSPHSPSPPAPLAPGLALPDASVLCSDSANSKFPVTVWQLDAEAGAVL